MTTPRGALAAAALCWALATAGAAHATPSTTFWAPSTPGVQAPGVLHLAYDTHFDARSLCPVDLGLELGVRPSKGLQAEVGFDLPYPTIGPDGPLAAPLMLNAKIGAPEGALFTGPPAWSAGVFGAGFTKRVTDYHVLHAVIGKAVPRVGALSVGGYYGLRPALLRSSEGAEERGGGMAGWFSPAIDVPRIDRIHLAWDLQTGRNVLGATGGGVALVFTPAVSLLTGPGFFLDPDLQPGGASWMWSLPLDLDVDLPAAP